MSAPKGTQAVVGLNNVRARLQSVCRDLKRPEATVELICVSKGFDREAIRPVIEAGERVFGENRIQETVEKWPELLALHPDIQLHLIGPLQSNKAEVAVGLFDVIHTVDRPKIAMVISAAIRKIGKTPKCYIQVNTGEEPQKAGVLPRDLPRLMEICRDEAHLDITGLMCIPPIDQLASPHFALLKSLAQEFGLGELSMGMSADFDLAVQLGSTAIRVGSAIFGDRRQ